MARCDPISQSASTPHKRVRGGGPDLKRAARAREADTVHKFQGRQKKLVILATVLDEIWRGRTGLRFVDYPHLINVAVSRAIGRFILVTNHAMLPTSRR